MVKKHSWFLTINNPTEFELKLLHSASKNTIAEHQLKLADGTFVAQGKIPECFYGGKEEKGLAYFGFSKEVGKSGTPHVHCICIFKRTQTFKKVKELFPVLTSNPSEAHLTRLLLTLVKTEGFTLSHTLLWTVCVSMSLMTTNLHSYLWKETSQSKIYNTTCN